MILKEHAAPPRCHPVPLLHGERQNKPWLMQSTLYRVMISIVCTCTLFVVVAAIIPIWQRGWQMTMQETCSHLRTSDINSYRLLASHRSWLPAWELNMPGTIDWKNTPNREGWSVVHVANLVSKWLWRIYVPEKYAALPADGEIVLDITEPQSCALEYHAKHVIDILMLFLYISL